MIELGKKLNSRYQITGNIGSGGMIKRQLDDSNEKH